MGQRAGEWREELGGMARLALPVVLSELGWMLQGIVDTLMVSRLGAVAIGAVALGNAVYYTTSLFGLGLLLGLDALISQSFGRGDDDSCRNWMAQGHYLVFIMTLPLMALIALLSLGMLHMGYEPVMAHQASRYLFLMNLGTLPLLIYGSSRRFLQGVGQMKWITFTYIFANLLNWFGNWVLIYGKLGMPALGVSGSALSTVLSRLLMAVVLQFFAWRYERKQGHALFANWPKPDFEKLRQILKIGLPAAMQLLLEMAAWSGITVIAGWLTPAALAAHQIVLNFASITFMVPLGIAQAASVGVGHAVGAGEIARARRAGWHALVLGVSFMSVAALVFMLFPSQLIGFYTHDPAVLGAGLGIFWLVAFFEIFDGTQTVMTGVLRGIGQTRYPMLVNLTGYWLFGLPLGIFLAFPCHWGLRGLWTGLTLALVIIALGLLLRWHTIKPGSIHALEE